MPTSGLDFRCAATCRPFYQSRRGSTVPDLAFVLLTIALFTLLIFIVRGAEKL